MAIKVGDVLDANITLTATDGSKIAGHGPLTITEAPTAPVDPVDPPIDPVDPPIDPVDPPAGGSAWLQPTSMVVSSLETGHIGHVYAWGAKDVFGYGYAYALEAAPAGVTIDRDTGRLAIVTALAVGDKAFKVSVTNRATGTLIGKFDFKFVVKMGVTSNRTGDQILHKTYDVAAGTWGNPAGALDYTDAIKKMRKAIIADQMAAGEGNHRADVLFRAGKEYHYTWNRFMAGIQYFRAMKTGTGADPIMKCVRNDPNDPYNSGPLGTESSNAMRYQGSIKNYCALVASTKMGDTTVTLKSAGDAAKLHPGRIHAVMSGSQQLDGYPPNVRQIDYCKVVSVSGGVVTLDRKLKYAHKEDYWEQQDSWLSFGRAWIVPWDMHDDGDDPMEPRMIQRGQFIGLDFVPGSSDISYMESFREMYFENCSIPNPQFTMSQFVACRNSRLHGGEPDKMTEQASYIDCTNDAEMGGATGVQYFLIRGGDYHAMQVSPRQLRVIDARIASHGSTYLNVPFSVAYNGPGLEYEFDGVEFVADGSQATWTWGNPPVSPAPARWDGNKFIIPRSFGPFQDWLVWTYEGLMLMKEGGTVAKPGDHGIITRVHAPADGSALWLDVEWKVGTKPTSGNLVIPQHGSRKLIWAGNTRISKGGWQDPSFACQVGTPADRDFPAGVV